MNKGIPKNGPLPRPTATPCLSWWPLFIFWAPSKGCLGLALHSLSWRGAECTIPKYASLVYLLFWADIFEKLQTQEKLWKLSINYPFVREIYIRKRLVPGRELIPEITFFTWETYLLGTQPLCPKHFLFSLSCKLHLPLWSPRSLALSLAQEGIWASIIWLPFESHIFVGLPCVCA